MGYTTVFSGHFDLTPALTPAQVAYLKRFATIRHVKRNAALCAAQPDPLRVAANLPTVGTDAEYFVAINNDELDFMMRRETDPTVVDDAVSPGTQPGMYCQWVPSRDGSKLMWDTGEKFYECKEWLEYIVCHFLQPWGVKITGRVVFAGEERDDRGYLTVAEVGGPRGRRVCLSIPDMKVNSKAVWNSWSQMEPEPEDDGESAQEE